MKIFPFLFLFVSSLSAQEVWTLRYSPNGSPLINTGLGGRPGLYLVSTSLQASQNGVWQGLYHTLQSTDGLSWMVRNLPPASMYGVEGQKLIGVGEAGIWTTDDGISHSWAFRPNNGMAPEGIAFGNGCWVVTCFNGDIVRSTSASGPWSYQTSPTDSIGGLAFGNGIFLARSGSSEAIRSIDGITWAVITATGLGQDIHGFANGDFIARATKSSDNGATWTAISTTGVTGLAQIYAGPNRFVARGTTNSLWTGVNPSPWTFRATGLSSTVPVTHVAWCGDMWIASGSGYVTTAPIINMAAPTAPALTAVPAMELTWPSVTGRYYQIQGSVDNQIWSDVGFLLLGNGSNLRFTTTASEGRKFFRVEVR